MVARRPGSRPNPGGLPCSTVEGESLVLKFRNWVPAQWIAPRMTPSYLFMAEECMEGPSGVEVLRETSTPDGPSIHSSAMNKYDGVMRGAIHWAGTQFRNLSTSDSPSTVEHGRPPGFGR